MDVKFNVMPSKVLKQNKKLWINNEDLELALFYLLFLLLIFFLVIVVVSRRFMSPNPVYLASLLLVFWPFGAAGQNQESRTKRFVLPFPLPFLLFPSQRPRPFYLFTHHRPPSLFFFLYNGFLRSSCHCYGYAILFSTSIFSIICHCLITNPPLDKYVSLGINLTQFLN